MRKLVWKLYYNVNLLNILVPLDSYAGGYDFFTEGKRQEHEVGGT